MKRHFLLCITLVLCGFQLSAQTLTPEEIEKDGETIISAFTRATLPKNVTSSNCKEADKNASQSSIKPNQYSEMSSDTLSGLHQYTNHDSITSNMTDDKYAVIKQLKGTIDTLKGTIDTLKHTIENETIISKKVLPWIICGSAILLIVLTICMIKAYILLKKLCNKPSEQPNSKNNHEESDYRSNDKGISPSPSAYTQPRRGYAQKESDLSPSTPKAGKEKGKNYLPEQKSPTKEWDVSDTSSNATVKGNPISPLSPSDAPQTKSILYAEVREDRLEITDSDNRQHYKITIDKDNPKRGKFEVTNNEEMIKKMIPNRQTYIDPLCDTEGYSGDATTIQTLAPGTVETTNGQIWEATQKAKVKFIKN